MATNQTLPPPTTYKAHTNISVDRNFATTAVMRPGVGFSVKWIAGDFVELDARATNGKQTVLAIHADGVPALIAALQTAVEGR